MNILVRDKEKAGKSAKGNSAALPVRLLAVSAVLLCCALFLLVSLGISEVRGKQDIQVMVSLDEGMDVEIPKGAGEYEIAKLLKEKGLIRYPILYRTLSRVQGYSTQYKAGVHTLRKGMGYDDIMKQLSSNTAKIPSRRFTIPEGLTIMQIAEKLAQEQLVNKDRFLEILRTENFTYRFLEGADERIKAPDRDFKMEGYLFPDTYEVGPEDDERTIIVKMLERFNEVFVPEYYEKAAKLNMTPDQVITLASIIEREARVEKDRKLISAVFHNRLNSKDLNRMESCATIQYILGYNKEVLTIEDTRIKSPYNTYLHPGLPPGPISNPGKAAIEAALDPALTDYLYFVAQKDGSHIFSNTYEEHLEAVKKTEAAK